MEYLQLGNSDIKVSRFCLGCMSFGDPASTMHAWTLNPDQSETIIKHALDLGINFIDTANTYSAGTSEEYLGRAIKKISLATKSYWQQKSILTKDTYQKPQLKGKSMDRLNDLALTMSIYTSFIALTIQHQWKKQCKLYTILSR